MAGNLFEKLSTDKMSTIQDAHMRAENIKNQMNTNSFGPPVVMSTGGRVPGMYYNK